MVDGFKGYSIAQLSIAGKISAVVIPHCLFGWQAFAEQDSRKPFFSLTYHFMHIIVSLYLYSGGGIPTRNWRF